jgi:acyl-CoA thioesterase I
VRPNLGAGSLRVCVIGDSIAAGTGDQRCLGWHGRLASRVIAGGADLTVYPLGVRGDTSEDVARRWQVEAEARLPTAFPRALIFQFGLNDCAMRTWYDGRSERRVSVERSLECTRTTLGSAAARYPTLMIGPAPVDDSRPGPQLVAGLRQRIRNDDIRDLDDRFEEAAQGVAVPYLSVFVALENDARWRRATLLGDGVHPSDEGYEVLAGLVDGWPAWQTLLAIVKGGS